MQKLSVALATHNEEENIGRCLNSVIGLASEIIIVDGESTDKTVEIAKSLNATVIQKSNEKNFHINKQIAIDNCKSAWILQLDADEVVSNELKAEILRLLKEDTLLGSDLENFPNGYYLPRKNWFLGRFLMKGGQYPDYTVRLYRKGKGRLPQKDVHEQAVVDGEIGYMTGAILHYPYKNFHAYITKWNRYNLFESSLMKKRFKSSNALQAFIIRPILYMLLKPIYWFLMTYIRHKGFMDLWQGFVFSFFSSLRFPVSYMLYLKNN